MPGNAEFITENVLNGASGPDELVDIVPGTTAAVEVSHTKEALKISWQTPEQAFNPRKVMFDNETKI